MALSPQAQQLMDEGKASPSHLTKGAVFMIARDVPDGWEARGGVQNASWSAVRDWYPAPAIVEARPPQPPPVEVGQWRQGTGIRFLITAIRDGRCAYTFLGESGQLYADVRGRSVFDSYEVCEPDPRWEES